jgi:hypothetical protein
MLANNIMKLERLFQRTFDNPLDQYIAAWPPSFVEVATVRGSSLEMLP